jgi:hypothetical protein
MSDAIEPSGGKGQPKHCMFQYATSYKYLNTKIYEDTDLITWEEALELWNKYKPQVISEIEDDISNPEMVIWTGCRDNTSYSHDAFHVDSETPTKDGEFVEIKTIIIDPNKVNMGVPVFEEN